MARKVKENKYGHEITRKRLPWVLPEGQMELRVMKLRLVNDTRFFECVALSSVRCTFDDAEIEVEAESMVALGMRVCLEPLYELMDGGRNVGLEVCLKWGAPIKTSNKREMRTCEILIDEDTAKDGF